MELELTIEQEFTVRRFEILVQKLNTEQCKELLNNLYRQSVVKEEFFKRLIKDRWGLG